MLLGDDIQESTDEEKTPPPSPKTPKTSKPKTPQKTPKRSPKPRPPPIHLPRPSPKHRVPQNIIINTAPAIIPEKEDCECDEKKENKLDQDFFGLVQSLAPQLYQTLVEKSFILDICSLNRKRVEANVCPTSCAPKAWDEQDCCRTESTPPAWFLQWLTTQKKSDQVPGIPDVPPPAAPQPLVQAFGGMAAPGAPRRGGPPVRFRGGGPTGEETVAVKEEARAATPAPRGTPPLPQLDVFAQQDLMDIDPAEERTGYGMPQTVFEDRGPRPGQYIPEGAHERKPIMAELEDPGLQAERVGFGMPQKRGPAPHMFKEEFQQYTDDPTMPRLEAEMPELEAGAHTAVTVSSDTSDTHSSQRTAPSPQGSVRTAYPAGASPTRTGIIITKVGSHWYTQGKN